ncbi:MAG: tetratricopeptide repeat protein [Ignavibacterium sp.]|nr:MAG: tetratricopeptide repeat protein [Ignavibacterium sp.]
MDHSFQHRINSAKDFETQGKILHAIQIYKVLIEEYPDQIESYINLADVYQLIGHKESAEKILSLIINRQPTNHELSIYYVQFLMQNNEWNRAQDKLSELSTEDSFVSYLTSYIYFMQNKSEIAKLHFLRFIISDEEPELIHEAYLFLAKIEFELKQYKSALKYAKKAEIMYDDFWELYLIYAKIYYSLQMYTHSSESILEGIKLNPDETQLYKWAGKIYVKLNNFIKAKKYFEKHIDLKESITSDDYLYLANACFQLGELKDAINFFDTAIKLDPDNLLALKGYEKTHNLINKNNASDV